MSSISVAKHRKERSNRFVLFSFVPQAQHHLRGTRNIISSKARTSLPHAAQMNDVEALPQMKLPSANDVCLRPMMLRFAQTELIRLLGALKYS